MSDSSTTSCKRCGEETNYPPPDMPESYRGYCPTCALDLAENGTLPKPTKAAMLNQIVGKLTTLLEQGGVFNVLTTETRSPSEIIETPIGSIQYSQN